MCPTYNKNKGLMLPLCFSHRYSEEIPQSCACSERWGRGQEGRRRTSTPAGFKPRSLSLSSVQTAALMPGVCPNRTAAGAWNCMWSWWRPHREEGAPATEGGEATDWSPLHPSGGSRNPPCNLPDGVPLSCAQGNNKGSQTEWRAGKKVNRGIQ